MTTSAPGRSAPLDTIIMVSTPENVAFDFRLAGPFPRLIALLLDIVILALIVSALGLISFALGFLGGGGIGLFLFALFIGWWGYGGLMETFFNGQTFGKRALGLRVVSDSGLAINAGQGILRNILRYADLLPPFFPGVLSMLISSRFQRLGDLAAETIVVIDGGRLIPPAPATEPKADEIREQIPARFRPDSGLIEALAAYVGRRHEFSLPRRRELAQTLALHFIRRWSLPSKTDPDMLLCAIYDEATMDRSEAEQRRRRFELAAKFDWIELVPTE